MIVSVRQASAVSLVAMSPFSSVWRISALPCTASLRISASLRVIFLTGQELNLSEEFIRADELPADLATVVFMSDPHKPQKNMHTCIYSMIYIPRLHI